MFSTKGVTDNGGKYIPYGIHNVEITGVTSKEAEGSASASVFIEFREKDGTKTLSERLPFSDKATVYSLRKIKHITTKVVTEAEIDAATANVKSVGEMAKVLNKILTGKSLTVKFNGKEVAGSNGKSNWYKAQLGFPPFAETIGTNPSTLKFDALKDIKRLDGSASSAPAQQIKQNSDPLPF